MTPNDKRSNDAEESGFERLVGDFETSNDFIARLAGTYGPPKGLLGETIQGSIDARGEVEGKHTEKRMNSYVGTNVSETPGEFEAKFLDTEGDR